MRPRVQDASGSWGLRGVTPPAELIGRKQSYEDFKKLIPVPPCWGDVDLIDRLIFLRAMCNGEILSEDLPAFVSESMSVTFFCELTVPRL